LNGTAAQQNWAARRGIGTPSGMTPMSFRRLALLATVALAVTAGTARADGTFPNNLSPTDRQGLENFASIRARAIDTARAEADAADLRHMDRALEGEAAALSPASMAGNWRCRSIQFGGGLALIAYSEFRCRITDDAAGLRLEKLTGSQRTSGTFYDIGETRLGYAGAAAWGDNEQPYRYGQDAERNQIGYLVPVSANHLRLELLDGGGTTFSILDLRR
jgi:hypothetical protein